MEQKFFNDGDMVMVHSLGENTPGEFKAIVRGHCFYNVGGCVYILEMIDRIAPHEVYPYTHTIMVSACVKAIEN